MYKIEKNNFYNVLYYRCQYHKPSFQKKGSLSLGFFQTEIDLVFSL
jgi:hypothetical protein